MSSFRVLYTDKAIKQLSKMDGANRRLIKEWINKNLVDTTVPRRTGRGLSGNLGQYWRYRIGDYRMIVDIRDKELIIIAVSIEHRSRVYKQRR